MKNTKNLETRVALLETKKTSQCAQLRPVLSTLTDDELDRLEKAVRQLGEDGAESLTDDDLKLIQGIEWVPVEQVA